MTPDLAARVALLDRLYTRYDGFLAGIDGLACREGCAACCTADVVLTSLEAHALITRLGPAQREGLEAALARGSTAEGFQPRVTTNGLADCCARGEAPPPETAPQGTGRCLLLRDERCPAYALRPFGCRCFVSRRTCRTTGCAEVDDVVLTVNTVFLQVLEHLDRPGCQGNFATLLALMSRPGPAAAYAAGHLDGHAWGLLPNRPLTILMVPPEHRGALAPLLGDLRRLLAG
jgi:hypothetical protein